MENENQPLFGLTVEGNIASMMSSTSQWGRILSICGIIFGGVFVILAIYLLVSISNATSSLSRYESGSDGFAGSLTALGSVGVITYFLMGVLIIVGNIFLLNYSNRVSVALKTNDTTTLTSAFAGLRNYFAFWAIILIIMLLLSLLGIVSNL